MLQFYYHPLSPLARRVWIALLEKEIAFEQIIVNLKDGEQFKPDYLKLNPFHHVPVIVDNGFRVLESLAILDYLEHRYPQPALLPSDSQKLAVVRMVQMISINELASQIIPIIVEAPDSPKRKRAKRKLNRVLKLFTELLADKSYFGGDRLSLGDIVAGNAVILITKLGCDLGKFPQIETWCDRLMQRTVWQQTQPNAEQIEVFKQTVIGLMRSTRYG